MWGVYLQLSNYNLLKVLSDYGTTIRRKTLIHFYSAKVAIIHNSDENKERTRGLLTVVKL